MNYLTEIPQELFNIIVSYVDNLKELGESISPFKKIRNRDWEFIFSIKYPEEYSNIKKIMKIDPKLREPRYTKNWKELILGYDLLNSNSHAYYLLEHRYPETLVLHNYARIYDEFPQFYYKLLSIPDINLEFPRRIYYNLDYIDGEINYEDIKDEGIIKYFKSGILDTELIHNFDSLSDILLLYLILSDGLTIDDHIYNIIYKSFKYAFKDLSNEEESFHRILLIQIYNTLPDIYKDRIKIDSGLMKRIKSFIEGLYL